MAERCPVTSLHCPYAGKKTCIVTRHHLYWPARDYTSPVEHAFRNLPENIQMESRCDHDEIHRTELPPKKPQIEQMLRALSQIAIEVEPYEQAA